ncbi:MAG: HNH endonuclease [Selenomonadaceae bacterium]|nr:HNH endonuclease [Selenomonadaceae bacterium]
MKHREKLFKLLRECVETPQESFAVEEMIRKVSGDMLPIETVSEMRTKCNGLKFYKNAGKNFCCTISIHRFVWTYFNGEIPDGCEIHHRDFNHDNNDIANLELVTKDEHKRIHAAIKSTRKPGKKSTFVCAVCGKEFQAVNRGNNAYCSATCKKVAERARNAEIRKCTVCGKQFSTSDDARFCSRKCIGEVLKCQEVKTCPVCGKIFSDVVSKRRKHCSPECAAEALRRREMRTCLHCGKEFSAQVRRTQKFCSRQCFYEHRRKNQF